MAKELTPYIAAFDEREAFGVADDFLYYVTADTWTTTASDSGSAGVVDGFRGILGLYPSDATAADNDETYVRTTNEIFKFVDDCMIQAEVRLQYTEAATDDANVAFGFADAVAANTLVDNGAGMKTSGDHVVILKVDGGTVWRAHGSKASTQTTTSSQLTAGGSAYQRLGIRVRCASSIAECTFYGGAATGNLWSSPLTDSNDKPIVIRLDYSSSPTDMHCFVAVKQGSANAETLLVDYIIAYQRRA